MMTLIFGIALLLESIVCFICIRPVHKQSKKILLLCAGMGLVSLCAWTSSGVAVLLVKLLLQATVFVCGICQMRWECARKKRARNLSALRARRQAVEQKGNLLQVPPIAG